MKKEVHPKYNPKAVYKCTCGAEFEIGSTREKISLEICSKCHPFYTGSRDLVDTAGRADKFKARQAKAGKVVKKKKEKKTSKTKKDK